MEVHTETKIPPLPPIVDQIKDYAETRLKLLKLEVIEGGSSTLAGVLTTLVTVIIALLAFIFASVTLALYLGTLLGSAWAGFGCVTFLYLLIAIIIILNKKGFEKTLSNIFIQKLLKS